MSNKTDLGKVSIVLKGEYNANTNYERLDVVTYQGSSYACKKDCKGIEVTNTTYWQLLAQHGEVTQEQYEDFKRSVLEDAKAEMDEYTEGKETELDTYTIQKKTELDDYEENKESELDTYTNTKISEFNTNATNKTNTFNENATAKTTAFNENATSKTNDFNTNSDTKTSEFNTNAETKTTTFNQNAETKVNNYNTNATNKTEEFDTNATEKTGEYNENAVEKIAEFNAEKEELQNEIDNLEELVLSELEDGNAEGTSIDIEDAAEWYGKLLPEGRTEQDTTSGKNLCISTKKISDTVISFSMLKKIEKTFTISFDINETLTANTIYFIVDDVQTNIGTISGNGRISKTLTISDELYNSIQASNSFDLRVYKPGASFSVPERPMIENGTEATEYEPYTGGIPAPNPEYPEEIRNVEGINIADIEQLYTEMQAFNSNNVKKEIVDNKDCIVFANNIYRVETGFRGLQLNYKPNTRYRIDMDVRVYDTSITAGKGLNIRICDSQDIVLKSVNVPASGENWQHVSLIMDINTTMSCLAFSYGSATNWCLTNLSIQEYVENKTYAYIPYNTIKFKQIGKNLAKIEDFTETSLGNATISVEKGIIKINGTTSNAYAFPVFKTNSSSVIFSIEVTGYTDKDIGNGSILLQQSDDNITWTTYLDISLKSNLAKQLTGTLDSSKYYRVRLYTNNNTFTNATIKVQLEYGTARTIFVAHSEQNISFPLAQGQKLMQGDYLADDGIHHVRRQVTLTAITSLSSTTISGLQYKFGQHRQLDMKLQGSDATSNFKCDRVAFSGDYDFSDRADTGYTVSNSFVILVDKNTTVEEYNSKFVGSILEYELAEEIIEPYTLEQQEAYNKLKKLKMNYGVNHIYTEGSIVEPNLKLEYKLSNKLKIQQELDGKQEKTEETQVIGWTNITLNEYADLDLNEYINAGKTRFTILLYIRKDANRQAIKFELTRSELDKLIAKALQGANNTLVITRSCMGITDINNIAYVRQTMMKSTGDNIIKLKYEVYENGASQSGFNNCEYCMYAE